MDNAGDFVITWTTFGQDSDLTQDYGIYARMYKANGSDYTNATGAALGEFRVNAIVAGDQVTPDVVHGFRRRLPCVWIGPDDSSDGVYCRVIAVNTSTYTPVTTLAANGQFYGIPYAASANPTPTPSTTPTFTLTGPISGSYAPGQTITISWTAANVTSNDVVTLCLDSDKTLFDGNEKWIEVDKVTAANGSGSYNFDPSGLAPGTYYVAGYMYDKSTKAFTNSTLTSAITIPAQSFTLSGPTSGTFAPGQNITITWTAANVSANDVITLCLDKDTTLFNGNEKWIEVDKVTAANGDGSYSFNPSGIAPGTYYVGGYMYDKSTKVFTYLTPDLAPSPSRPRAFTLTGPTSGTFAPGRILRSTGRPPTSPPTTLSPSAWTPTPPSGTATRNGSRSTR